MLIVPTPTTEMLIETLKQLDAHDRQNKQSIQARTHEDQLIAEDDERQRQEDLFGTYDRKD